MQTARSSALTLQLIDALFASPIITATRAQELLNVTFRSAQHNIEVLQEAGLLEEITGQRRYRVYLAREVFEVINGDG